MAALTTTEERKTYKKVSRIACSYFEALCSLNRVCEGFEITEEDEEGKNPTQTYSIEVWERDPYNLMQKVFEAENG